MRLTKFCDCGAPFINVTSGAACSNNCDRRGIVPRLTDKEQRAAVTWFRGQKLPRAEEAPVKLLVGARWVRAYWTPDATRTFRRPCGDERKSAQPYLLVRPDGDFAILRLVPDLRVSATRLCN